MQTAAQKAAEEHRERHQHNDPTRGFKARPESLQICFTALLLGTANAPEFEGRDDLLELLLHTISLLDSHRRNLQKWIP